MKQKGKIVLLGYLDFVFRLRLKLQEGCWAKVSQVTVLFVGASHGAPRTILGLSGGRFGLWGLGFRV